MTYEMIFQQARDAAAQRMRSGDPLLPDDTVCVIASASGKLYTGFNRRENVNGTLRNIHAELEAMRAMQSAGETAILTVLLLSCANGMPLLPCDNCMRSIVALNPENMRCELMMMDRAVPLAQFLSSMMPNRNPQASMQVSQPYRQAKPAVTSVSAVSVQVPEATNDADLLRSKVTDLLNTVDEDITEDDDMPEKKKRFGGLFRKKP